MNQSTLNYKFSETFSLKENFELKNQGSEAKVYEGNFLGKSAILKERFTKMYRHPDLDKSLTSERMRAEVRALNKCQEIGVKCPAVYFADLQSRCIILQKIAHSITVKEYLKSVLDERGVDGINLLSPLACKIGEGIAKMHNNALVHGDLTTSNLMLKSENVKDLDLKQNFDVYFIDFGLSKRNIDLEDKAVDLYVLERAISSSHPNSDKFYDTILEKYFETITDAYLVRMKLEDVRHRGRKRTMVG